MLRQAKVAVPAGHKHHIVTEILSLYLQLLHDDDVSFEDVEHGVEGALVAPWLIAKRVADAVDVPGCDAEGHCGLSKSGASCLGSFMGRGRGRRYAAA